MNMLANLTDDQLMAQILGAEYQIKCAQDHKDVDHEEEYRLKMSHLMAELTARMESENHE